LNLQLDEEDGGCLLCGARSQRLTETSERAPEVMATIPHRRYGLATTAAGLIGNFSAIDVADAHVP
jgi:hypothetical protein